MQGATLRLKRHELEIIGCGINSCVVRGSKGVCVREREREMCCIVLNESRGGEMVEEKDVKIVCVDFCWHLSASILNTQDENTSSY